MELRVTLTEKPKLELVFDAITLRLLPRGSELSSRER